MEKEQWLQNDQQTWVVISKWKVCSGFRAVNPRNPWNPRGEKARPHLTPGSTPKVSITSHIKLQPGSSSLLLTPLFTPGSCCRIWRIKKSRPGCFGVGGHFNHYFIQRLVQFTSWQLGWMWGDDVLANVHKMKDFLLTSTASSTKLTLLTLLLTVVSS